MNYGLESSSGIRYDVQHHTYVQERDGITYKLDNETKQWVPLDSYVDQVNQIKYQYSKKHQTWIPDRSTYSSKDGEGRELTYVWLKDALQWSLLSSVDSYTDHLTGVKYRWNNETQSWDNEGTEPIEDLNETTGRLPSSSVATAKPTEKEKKKPTEGESNGSVRSAEARDGRAWLSVFESPIDQNDVDSGKIMVFLS